MKLERRKGLHSRESIFLQTRAYRIFYQSGKEEFIKIYFGRRVW